MIKYYLTDKESEAISKATDKEICSILDRGYNGNPEYWMAASSEAKRRGIYYRTSTSKKRWYKFW